MRTDIYQRGEAVHKSQFTAPESFGRIGRRQPIARSLPAARAHDRERGAVVVDNRSFAIELHAAAGADRSRRIGDLVALSIRFFAHRVQRLIAGPHASSNFPFFQHKE